MTSYPARPPLSETERRAIDDAIARYVERIASARGRRAAALAPHLAALEAEAIHVIRETAAEVEKPVLLYSIGKDSGVLLHLALKAFAPGPLPFPALHIDTTFKFREMIHFRDRLAGDLGVELLVAINWDGVAQKIAPWSHGSSFHTTAMKTQPLRAALDQHGFGAALGGARRDEEKSRAKERIVSVRSPGHGWDPKLQRPELWNLFNLRTAPGETLRVFPISNWTEADIWAYILSERIPLPPLYCARPLPTVIRNGQIFAVDDDRMPLEPSEPVTRWVRFRTLGCYPLTAGVESRAETIEAVVAETLAARTSERSGRLIDYDEPAAMERKKREGYF